MNERDVAEGQAAREWHFNRFGVDEAQPAQAGIDQPLTTEEMVQSETDVMATQQKPRVETVYRGDQPVSVFHPGIDFSKGDSLHF